MRLLLISPACDGTDVGEAWVGYQWARHMSQRHDTTVLTMRRWGSPPIADQLPEARVIEWESPRLLQLFGRFTSLAKPDYIGFHRRVSRWIREEHRAGRSFDVAHQPVPVAMRYPSPVVGTGIPLVLGPVGGGLSDPPGFDKDEDTSPWYTRLRGIDAWRMRHDPTLRRTYSQADLVLGIASYVEEALANVPVRRLEVMSETAIESLPPPVDRSGSRRPLRLLFVGRVIRTKGARDAVRAMSLLADVDVRLDIVGEGPDRVACEDLTRELRLKDRITFHGWKDRSEVDSYYRDADAFVFPSYREPGGNVVFEAMSFGLPVIVVDRGGPGAAVDDHSGIRVEATSPTQLAESIADAVQRLANDDLRTQMGTAAISRVRSVGLWAAKVEKMDRYYTEIARSAGTPAP